MRSEEVKSLVGGGGGLRGGGESDALVGGVEDGVVALEESVPVDEVETLARVAPKVSNDEEDAIWISTNIGVQ